MKTVMITEPSSISVENTSERYTECGENEALLRVRYCGICGADVASYTGNQPFTTYPRIPGHEFSAEIVSLPSVYNGDLRVGEKVTANPYFNCGKCYSCRRGHVNCCHDNQTMGVQRDGSFREYIKMPVSRIYSGKGLDLKTLALIEPFSIGWHAVSSIDFSKFGKSGVKPKILVIGAGPIGLFALISAKLKGKEYGASVYSADLLDGRLAKAKYFGADGTVNTSTADIKEYTDSVTGGDGFDVCIEACGAPETFMMAIDSCAFAGDVVLIGNGKRPTTFVHSVILKKELTIHGSRNSLPEDFTGLIDYVARGETDISSMISGVYSVDDCKKAFDALVTNDGSLCKLLIEL